MKTAAQLGDKSVVSQIKNIQGKTENTSVKMFSYYALVKLEEDIDGNAKKLKDELKNQNPIMRYWAAHYLSMTDRFEAIGDLINALEIENYYWVRREMDFAIDLLGKRKKDLEE